MEGLTSASDIEFLHSFTMAETDVVSDMPKPVDDKLPREHECYCSITYEWLEAHLDSGRFISMPDTEQENSRKSFVLYQEPTVVFKEFVVDHSDQEPTVVFKESVVDHSDQQQWPSLSASKAQTDHKVFTLTSSAWSKRPDSVEEQERQASHTVSTDALEDQDDKKEKVSKRPDSVEEQERQASHTVSINALGDQDDKKEKVTDGQISNLAEKTGNFTSGQRPTSNDGVRPMMEKEMTDVVKCILEKERVNPLSVKNLDEDKGVRPMTEKEMTDVVKGVLKKERVNPLSVKNLDEDNFVPDLSDEHMFPSLSSVSTRITPCIQGEKWIHKV